MNKDLLIQEFKNIVIKGKVLVDEFMKNHTYFKIGGPVDIMILPGSIEEIQESIKLCKNYNIKYHVIGNGTNLLVRDKGIRGVVIKIDENLSNMRVEKNKIVAEGGALLSKVSKLALSNSLTGLEFAGGIPGSLGGAVAMNAGAYGPEMKDVVIKVKCIDMEGNLLEFNNEEMDFEYRHSRALSEDLLVVEAEMELTIGNYDEIKAYMDELTQKRTSKQPLSMASAGSTFKRPVGDYASRLIDVAGLRGLRFGDAQVSTKHCGFVVNLGSATCDEVLNLIKIIQKTVRDKYEIELETEVKIIGEE